MNRHDIQQCSQNDDSGQNKLKSVTEKKKKNLKENECFRRRKDHLQLIKFIHSFQ